MSIFTTEVVQNVRYTDLLEDLRFDDYEVHVKLSNVKLISKGLSYKATMSIEIVVDLIFDSLSFAYDVVVNFANLLSEPKVDIVTTDIHRMPVYIENTEDLIDIKTLDDGLVDSFNTSKRISDIVHDVIEDSAKLEIVDDY